MKCVSETALERRKFEHPVRGEETSTRPARVRLIRTLMDCRSKNIVAKVLDEKQAGREIVCVYLGR